MQMSEHEFWLSSPSKVVKMIDIYQDESKAVTVENYESKYFSDQRVVTSMKEMEGWGSEQCL